MMATEIERLKQEIAERQAQIAGLKRKPKVK